MCSCIFRLSELLVSNHLKKKTYLNPTIKTLNPPLFTAMSQACLLNAQAPVPISIQVGIPKFMCGNTCV